MAEFTRDLFNLLMQHEGREFEDDPHDKPTKFGITDVVIREAYEQGIIFSTECSFADYNSIKNYIKNLSEKKAFDILKGLFFDKLKLSKIVYQGVADKICDMALPMGRFYATICAQRACRSVSRGEKLLKEDGIIGPYTLAAINLCFDKNFLCAYRSECAAYFRFVVQSKPDKERYLKGWLNRAYE